MSAADGLPAGQADALLEAAKAAFAHGVDLTSAIGAVLALLTAVVIGVALRAAHRATRRAADQGALVDA